MRKLIERTVVSNWMDGFSDMGRVAYEMDWACESLTIEQSVVKIVNDWRLEPGEFTHGLLSCVEACSDKSLLTWLTAQVSQRCRGYKVDLCR